MKKFTATLAGLLVLAICYGAGFRHGRHSRPIPHVDAPARAFSFTDENLSEGFLRQSNPIYFTWDERAGCVAAYSETNGIIDKVRGYYYLRYSPLNGEPIKRKNED